MKKTNYQITIGYKAVITVDIKAETEADAKKIAIAEFEKQKEKMFKARTVSLQDDTFKADGIVDMDATWNMYDA